MKDARHRSRATSACLPCRKARIRCVATRPKSICVNCADNGLECRFDTKDGRKERASAKAITEALTKRVRQLENLLRATQSVQQPAQEEAQTDGQAPAGATPMDLDADRSKESDVLLLAEDSSAEAPSPIHSEGAAGVPVDVGNHGVDDSDGANALPTPDAEDGIVVCVSVAQEDVNHDGSDTASTRSTSESTSSGTLQHGRRSPSGDAPPSSSTSTSTAPSPLPIRFDMASGRVRYFGPTTCTNVLSHLDREAGAATASATRASDNDHDHDHWPIGLAVRELTPAAHDHLMERFWTCYNACLQTVHRGAFEAGGAFYSLFLHVAMLATGFRFADKRRADVRRLALGSGGRFASTLHAKAVALAKGELDGPGGVASIPALALLADVEFHLGRDESGWLFAGMALRLVTDVGLHVDPGPLGVSALETEVRRVVLWACIQHDLYWSTYLGRPTLLKQADIALACLTRDGLARAAGDDEEASTSLAARLTEYGCQLVAFMRPLCDRVGAAPARAAAMAAVAADLHAWHDALPADVQWAAQHADMPVSFYLMHSRYHALLVLLHRQDGAADAAASRAVCRWHAGRVTEVMAAYGRHLDLALVFGTAVSHIGTAATWLLHEAEEMKAAEAAATGDSSAHSRRRATVLAQLRSARNSMQRMAETYPLARHMQQMVDEYLAREDKDTAAWAQAGGSSSCVCCCCCCANSSAGTADPGTADPWSLAAPRRDASAAAPFYNLDPRLWSLPAPPLVPASPTTLQSLPYVSSSLLLAGHNGAGTVDTDGFATSLGAYSPSAFDWHPEDMSPL